MCDTALTASLMPREIVEAIQYASRHYVDLDELHDRMGAQITGLLEIAAAMGTAGPASALTLGTADGSGQGEDQAAALSQQNEE